MRDYLLLLNYIFDPFCFLAHIRSSLINQTPIVIYVKYIEFVRSIVLVQRRWTNIFYKKFITYHFYEFPHGSFSNAFRKFLLLSKLRNILIIISCNFNGDFWPLITLLLQYFSTVSFVKQAINMFMKSYVFKCTFNKSFKPFPLKFLNASPLDLMNKLCLLLMFQDFDF